MSTILDALKRLEEQLRKDAGQKTAEPPVARTDFFNSRAEVSAQPKEAESVDEDEVTKVYLSLMEMIGRIQDRVEAMVAGERAESGKSAGELAQRLGALQNEMVRQRNAFQEDLRQRDEDMNAAKNMLGAVQAELARPRDTGPDAKNVLAAVQAHLEPLRNELARQRDAFQEDLRQRDADMKNMLAAMQAQVEPLQDELARQRDAHHEILRQRDADVNAARAASAASHAQVEPLRQDAAEIGRAMAELARTVSAMQNDLAWQRETHQEELKLRDAEIEEARAAVSASQTQLYPLRQDLVESKRAFGELARAMSALQDDLTRRVESLQDEVRTIDAARPIQPAEPAVPQSEIEPLGQGVAEAHRSIAELARSVAALQHDVARQREGIIGEARKRETDRDDAKAAAAAAQAQFDGLARSQAEVAEACADLKRTAAALQHAVERQQDALHDEARRLDADRDADKAALASVAARVDDLAQASTQASGLVADLAQELAALRNDMALQREEAAQLVAAQADVAQRQTASQDAASLDALRETALAAVRGEVGPIGKAQEETGLAIADLLRAVTSLQADYARQREAFREEIRQRDAERDTAKTALATLQSQVESLQEAPAAGAPVMTAMQDTRPAVPAMEHKETVPTPPLDKYAAQKLHGVAAKAYAEGHYTEALRMLETLDDAFPNNTSVIYNRAACLIALERHDEARRLCDYLITHLNYGPAVELKGRVKA